MRLKNRVCLWFAGFSFGFLAGPVAGASQAEIEALKGNISQYEDYVQGDLDKLNTCRSNCVTECRDDCVNRYPIPPSSNETLKNTCQQGCTSDKCDAGVCHVDKVDYDNNKEKLEGYKASLAELEGKVANPTADSNATVNQIKKEKQNMKLYALMGVGATAYLGYKAKGCCAQCGGFGGSCCWACGPLIAATGFAGYQTMRLFKKRDDFQNTEVSLCAEDAVTASGCGVEDPSSSSLPDLPEIPGCEPPNDCNPLPPILDLGPDEPLGPNIPPDPNNPSNPPPGHNQVAGNIPTGFGRTFRPPGGWPGGRNPFDGLTSENTKSGGFDPDSLTKQQKKQFQKMMKPLKDKQAAFLDKHGLNDGDEASVNGALGSGFGGSAGAGGSSKGFPKSDSGRSPSSAKKIASMSLRPKGSPAKSLADQLKEMLKNKYGEGGGAGRANSFADKSVQVGSDVVGVAEDNIFMMVHRRHRKLEGNERFIRDGF